jgi:hypothetical protein
MSDAARTEFLARIAHALTVCSRETYEAGTDNVLEPQVLRAYNELMHRVTASVHDHLTGFKGFSVETVLELMRAFGEKHNRVKEIASTIERARRKMSANS